MSYILMALEILSSLLFTPFLIRSFGNVEYGIYSLVISITSYLTLLDLGVGNATIRYMTKYRFLNETNKQKNLLSVTFLFYLFVSILVGLICLWINNRMEMFFSEGLTPEQIIRARKMFAITTLNVIATMILSPFNKIIIAFEKFVVQKILDIAKIVIRVAISIIILINGGKGIEIVSVNFLMTLCFGIVSMLYVFLRLRIFFGFKGINFNFIKEMIGYSTFIFIQMIATQINAMAGQILIGALVKSSAVILGVYAVGAQINQYFQSIASGINGVIMPGVVKMVEEGASSKELSDEMIKIGRMIFAFLGIIWGVFVVVGEKFINLWVGESYSKAYFVTCILITPIMITLIQSIGTQILWAKNQHKVQAYLKICMSVLNIFITVILIKWDPLIGTSLGTAIAIILGDIVVMNIVFTKYIGISMKQYYKGLFKGIFPSLIVTILIGTVWKMSIQYSSWIGLSINCTVMLGVYSSLMYLRGMNNYEKKLLMSILKK